MAKGEREGKAGEEKGEKPIVVYGAMAANLGIAVAKFFAAAFTGSSSMLAEAIHSTADTGNEVLLLLGLKRSKKPADDEHPYGYGKEMYFWSLLVAIVLFALGGGMSIYEGITHWLHPHPIEDVAWSFSVLGIALVFEGTSFGIAVYHLAEKKPERWSIFTAFHRSKDPSVFSVVAEDFAAILGIFAAFFGVLFAWLFDAPVIDAIGSLCVGTILCVVSVFLVVESRALLIGESGGRALVDDVRELTLGDPAVCRVGRPLTMQLGPREVLLNLDIDFAADLTIEALREAVDRIEQKIRARRPEVTRIFVEARSLKPQRGPAPAT